MVNPSWSSTDSRSPKIPSSRNCLVSVNLANAACATFVRSRLSIQFVLTVPLCNFSGSEAVSSKQNQLKSGQKRRGKRNKFEPLEVKVLSHLVDEDTNTIPSHVLALIVKVKVLIAYIREVKLGWTLGENKNSPATYRGHLFFVRLLHGCLVALMVNQVD
jgi:hypothetical protein